MPVGYYIDQDGTHRPHMGSMWIKVPPSEIPGITNLPVGTKLRYLGYDRWCSSIFETEDGNRYDIAREVLNQFWEYYPQ